MAARTFVAATAGGRGGRVIVIDYVLPIRCDSACEPETHDALARYVATLAPRARVILADGSPTEVLAMHRARFGDEVVHVAVVPRSANGKVDGVRTGMWHATGERVIVADDDVRYTETSLEAVAAALDDCDMVIPQNVFTREVPWHARWDTARSLVNRALGTDYPGTLAIRRSAFDAIGGYDGDVLFENLELIRTIQVAGGIVRARRDLFVERLAPTTDRFVEQRVRQAYDDFARPSRLAAALATVPLCVAAVRGRRWREIAAGAFGMIALAEIGRRRDGADAYIPATASLFAPLWVLERGLCAWLAVASRLILGGCIYRGTIIRRAATSRRELRRRWRARRRGIRRTAASSWTVRSDRAARPLAAG